MTDIASIFAGPSALRPGRQKLERLFCLKNVYSSMFYKYIESGVINTLDDNDKENPIRNEDELRHLRLPRQILRRYIWR
jgi:hypothetical protein